MLHVKVLASVGEVAVVVAQVVVDAVEQPPVIFVKAATDLHSKMLMAGVLVAAAAAAHQPVALVVSFTFDKSDRLC